MAERNFSAKLAGKFVDDDDLIRTGRAWVEIDGFDFLHIPVPTGFDKTMNAFEAQAEQVAKDAAASGKYASAAKSSASAAAASAGKAAESEGHVSSDAKKAQDGATRAETAAGNAKQSETNAEDAASRASNSATSANRSSVWVSNAEQRAEKSASAASTSASSAKADADRAANIASSTSWNGDRLTVNGKTSPSLRGPKGDPGTSGASTWDAVTGKPTTFPPSGHTHKMADISDLPGITYKTENNALVQRYSNGQIGVPIEPTLDQYATSKKYVDTAIASEKARTVGMVWMVETESAAQAKESSCQKGDFIQVAQTGNIYQVV